MPFGFMDMSENYIARYKQAVMRLLKEKNEQEWEDEVRKQEIRLLESLWRDVNGSV